jgi:putative pyruvate formate lyase activating enzyme
VRLPWQEIAERSRTLAARLSSCDLCPRRCGVDRSAGVLGTCRTGLAAKVASAFPHYGEEAVLVGRGGSGTIFLAECNLRCAFCQNIEVSHGGEGRDLDARAIADLMLVLRDSGCCNVNLVTPSHVVPQVVAALALARRDGLDLPVVYNTSGYDAPDTLRLLDGVVDVYMPDLKTLDHGQAAAWFAAPDYPEVARDAIREMHRQVGDLVIGEDGVARRGLLVRHLVMPGAARDAAEVFRFLADLSPATYVNVMGQYRPFGAVARLAGLDRRPDPSAVARARRAARAAGLVRLDPG